MPNINDKGNNQRKWQYLRKLSSTKYRGTVKFWPYYKSNVSWLQNNNLLRLPYFNYYRLIFKYIIKYGFDLWTIFLWSEFLLDLNFQPVGINCKLKVVLKMEINFILRRLTTYLFFLEHKNIENLDIKFFYHFHGHCTAYMIWLMHHLDSINIICCICHSRFPTNLF